MHRVTLALLVSVAFFAMSSTAHAASVLFSNSGPGVNGVTLNASALFEINGNQLKITLRNTGDTSGNNTDVSGNTLTGVFFDLPSNIKLTPVSAAIAPGDLLQGSTSSPGPSTSTTTNVGGEFKYATGTWSGHDGNNAISSSGYVSGSMGNFNGANLDDPGSLDGINFGIIAPITSQNKFKPNGGLANDPLIEGEVVFTMTIAGGTLTTGQISNVSFQYGTSLSEPKLPPGYRPPPPVPEPAALLLLAPAVAFALRKRAAKKTAR